MAYWQQQAAEYAPVRQLRSAVRAGDVGALEACLAAEGRAYLNTAGTEGWPPLAHAAWQGHSGCVEALLQAGANPNAASRLTGSMPLHYAAHSGSAACTEALLAGGANPRAVTVTDGWGDLGKEAPLHWAGMRGSAAVVCLLLQAAPETAEWKDASGRTPLDAAMQGGHVAAARCLLEASQMPTDQLLRLLASSSPAFQPCYAPLAAHQPLSVAEWAHIPIPCAGLGAALPAVLQRSTDEAALLARRLPPGDQQRMWVFALCLARAQRPSDACGMPPLPTPITWRLLVLCVAD